MTAPTLILTRKIVISDVKREILVNNLSALPESVTMHVTAETALTKLHVDSTRREHFVAMENTLRQERFATYMMIAQIGEMKKIASKRDAS
jgi:hypothetical protein